MQRYAEERIQETRSPVPPGTSETVHFGPPTAGRIFVRVLVSALVEPDGPVPFSGDLSRPRDGRTGAARTAAAGTAGAAATRVTDTAAGRVVIPRTPGNVQPFLGRLPDVPGIDAGRPGLMDPGFDFDDFEPLPPIPDPPPLEAFRVTILDGQGEERFSAPATLAGIEWPKPASPLAHLAHLTSPLTGPGPRWTVRIDNGSNRRVRMTIVVEFYGQRPIHERDVALDFIEEKLNVLYNVPQPIKLRFGNRWVIVPIEEFLDSTPPFVLRMLLGTSAPPGSEALRDAARQFLVKYWEKLRARQDRLEALEELGDELPVPLRAFLSQQADRDLPAINPAQPPGFPVWRSAFYLELDPDWALVHHDLAETVVDLEAEFFTQGLTSEELSIHATVVDGRFALHVQVRFPRDTGRIDLINLIAVKSPGLSKLLDGAHTFIDGLLSIFGKDVERPEIRFGRLDVDVYLILQPGKEPGLDVVAKAAVDINLGDPWLGYIAGGFVEQAFERILPKEEPGLLRDLARQLQGWLLGDLDLELVGGRQSLALEYAGEPVKPPEMSLRPGVTFTPEPMEPGHLAKIDHIVVLMMENRSFDHMLGYLAQPHVARDGVTQRPGRSDIEGIGPGLVNVGAAMGASLPERSYAPFPLDQPLPFSLSSDAIGYRRGTRFVFDPGHAFGAAKTQRRGQNAGFVEDFQKRLEGLREDGRAPLLTDRDIWELRGEIMGYHTARHVPAYDFFAEEYVVCDHWFSAWPGHTWPNRFVTLTGKLAPGRNGLPEVSNPDLSDFDPLEEPTIFDALSDGGVSWAYFEHDFGMIRTFSRYTFDTENVRSATDPENGFFALARAGKLPAVTFIEPDLTDLPPGSDDHPPSDIADGQILVKGIYDALVSHPGAWNKTLFVITYDEGGGFYDHVWPESYSLENGEFVALGIDPDPPTVDSVEGGKLVDHYGFRVPAFVISPWVEAGGASDEVYDHTTILKTIVQRFLPEKPPMLGGRYLGAASLEPLLARAFPRPIRTGPSIVASLDPDPGPSGPPPLPTDDFRRFMSGIRERFRVRR